MGASARPLPSRIVWRSPSSDTPLPLGLSLAAARELNRTLLASASNPSSTPEDRTASIQSALQVAQYLRENVLQGVPSPKDESSYGGAFFCFCAPLSSSSRFTTLAADAFPPLRCIFFYLLLLIFESSLCSPASLPVETCQQLCASSHQLFWATTTPSRRQSLLRHSQRLNRQ